MLVIASSTLKWNSAAIDDQEDSFTSRYVIFNIFNYVRPEFSWRNNKNRQNTGAFGSYWGLPQWLDTILKKQGRVIYIGRVMYVEYNAKKIRIYDAYYTYDV